MKEFISVYNPSIKRKDLEYVLESMVNDKLEYGEVAQKFEEKLAERSGHKYVLCINSYYNSIDLVFEALNFEPGDEVIIPSFAPVIYLDVLLRRGLTPVVIDVNEKSYFPSVEQVKNAVTEKTKALIIIHHFGYTMDCSSYMEKVPLIIEDITKVIGFGTNGKKTGGSAKFSIASFLSSETITTGSGGAVFCNDKKEYQKLCAITQGTEEEDYRYKISCLMPDLNAAMGISQLLTLDHRLKLREAIGSIYKESLLKGKGSFLEPIENNDRCYSDFPIQIPSSLKETVAFFRKSGIEVIRPFKKTLHQYLLLSKENYPNTEKLYLTTLLIPINSNLPRKEVIHISKNLIALF